MPKGTGNYPKFFSFRGEHEATVANFSKHWLEIRDAKEFKHDKSVETCTDYYYTQDKF